MSNKIYIFGAIFGVLIGYGILHIAGYGLFFASNPNAIPSAQLQKQAKAFEATTFDGQEISLAQFKGQPVIVNFWASWCVACRQEAHILEEAHQKYTPKGAVFIGIAINDTREASLGFIQRFGKTYLLAPDDKTGSISLDYGVTAVPETFFIDRTGIIQEKILGAVTRNRLEAFLDGQI